MGGIIGGVANAFIGADAAKTAAGQEGAADNHAAANTAAMYQQTRADLSPYNQAGQNALVEYQNLYGLNGAKPQTDALTAYGLPGLTFQPTQAQLEATPGYQFDLAQGQQGVANANAAQGRGISGAALKGAANYATGLANNTLTTQQQIFQQNLGNIINPLQNMSNLGESAATSIGQIGANLNQQQNAAITAGGQASAAGTIGEAQAIEGGINSVGNSLSMNSLMGNYGGSF